MRLYGDSLTFRKIFIVGVAKIIFTNCPIVVKQGSLNMIGEHVVRHQILPS